MRVWTRLAVMAAVMVAGITGASASLNGTLYAEVAPVYDGSNGSTSFLRLFGGVASASSTFTIKVVATTSGATLGTATISVPKDASPQFPFSTILAKANATTAADHGYALYIQNPEATAGYQHVSYNGTSTLFENVSNCAYNLDAAVKAAYPSLVLTNLHTTALAKNTYPTEIDIHNYWNAAITYGVYVYDAGTADSSGVIRAGSGALVGSKTYMVFANSSKALSMSQIQSDIGWTPAANQLHANVIVTDVANQAPVEVLGAAIVNSNLGGAVNMSEACAVNAPPATTSTGGGAYLN